MKQIHRIAKKIHLWLGLISGLIASVSGLSGSLYVWQPEITAALNPGILKTGNRHAVSETTIHESASHLYETYAGNIAYLNLPYREQQTNQVVFKNGKALYFHPETQELLGEKTFSILFFEGLLQFHRTLFIPKYGKYIMGGSAVLFFMLLLTSGIYLWWKHHKPKLRKGFTMSGKKKGIFFNYDLHKVTGIFFFIPLLIMAATGSYFTFIPVWNNIFKLADAREAEPAGIPDAPLFLKPEDLLHRPADDGYKLRAVYFPKDSSGSFRFRYIRNREITQGLRQTKEIAIAPGNRVVLYSEYMRNRISEKIAAQMYPVHIGETLGLWGRMLIFIAGFIPAALFITGYRLFRYRNIFSYRRSAGAGPNRNC